MDIAVVLTEQKYKGEFTLRISSHFTSSIKVDWTGPWPLSSLVAVARRLRIDVHDANDNYNA